MSRQSSLSNVRSLLRQEERIPSCSIRSGGAIIGVAYQDVVVQLHLQVAQTQAYLQAMISQAQLKANIVSYVRANPNAVAINIVLAVVGRADDYSVDMPVLLETLVDDGWLIESNGRYQFNGDKVQ